jgi:hypothetical protein
LLYPQIPASYLDKTCYVPQREQKDKERGKGGCELVSMLSTEKAGIFLELQAVNMAKKHYTFFPN